MSLEFKPSFQSFDLSGSVSDFAIDEHFQCGPWNNILYLTAMRRVRMKRKKVKAPIFFILVSCCTWSTTTAANLFVAVVRIAILKHRPGSRLIYFHQPFNSFHVLSKSAQRVRTHQSHNSPTSDVCQCQLAKVGYRWNRLDEPVFMARPKPLLTEFGVHHWLESCGVSYSSS